MNRRIDLTLNSDFSRRSNLIDIQPIGPRDEVDGENMTMDQYERLIRRESIFGERNHPSRTHIILESGRRFNEAEICLRCGKAIRFPWERGRFDLCEDCYQEIHRDDEQTNPTPERGEILFSLK